MIGLDQYGDPYDEPEEDDRAELLEALAMMVDQYCCTDDDEEWDSGALTASAVAMRVLARNGRFRITHQYGRVVVGELLREPPWAD